jgi:polar amino acid transport system permease protein
MTTPEKQTFDPHLPIIPGNENVQRFDPWWWMVFAVIGLIALLAVARPDPYWRIIKFVSDGLGTTVQVTVMTFLLVLVVGLVGALGRLSKIKIVSGIATVYVEVARGIPLLVQLIFWYFAFPSIIQDLGTTLNIRAFQEYLANPIAMAILGLTICYAAYMTEIYRAGIQSISKGQMEAARSLGMTYVQAMRYVILPQALRVILPPVGNEFISLLKDSSLVSVVAVADITRRGREFTGITPLPIETWMMIALIYLVMTTFSARIVGWLERRSRLER